MSAGMRTWRRNLTVLALAALAAGLLPGEGSALLVEDFESYADSPALAAAWFDGAATPVQLLESGTVHGGSQAMSFAYDHSTEAFNSVILDLGVAQDWSAYDTFSLWVFGDPLNSSESVGMALSDGILVLGQSIAPAMTQIDAWTRLDFDLSGYSSLASVLWIGVGTGAEDGGTGTILLDDFSVLAVPEPQTGLLVAVGLLALALRRRRAA
jgi:hypothetical protein